jgi:hypothetical protein
MNIIDVLIIIKEVYRESKTAIQQKFYNLVVKRRVLQMRE